MTTKVFHSLSTSFTLYNYAKSNLVSISCLSLQGILLAPYTDLLNEQLVM